MKVIYFCDPIGIDGDLEREEWGISDRELKGLGLDVGKVTVTSIPPFDELFDVLFFDWGGMSMGNSLMDSFCREIIKLAEDNPSRFFVMASNFTTDAMKDALHELDPKPQNVYLDFRSFVKACKDQGLVKRGKLVL